MGPFTQEFHLVDEPISLSGSSEDCEDPVATVTLSFIQPIKETLKDSQDLEIMPIILCNRWNHTALSCPKRLSHMISPIANVASSSLNPNITWYPDSGTSHHVTPDLVGMAGISPYGKGLQITNTCTSTLQTPTNTFTLNHVLHVPEITRRLLSVQKFAKENNVIFEFDGFSCLVKDQFHKIPLLQGGIKDGLYSFDSKDFTRPHAFLSAHASPFIWHQRLGHPHLRALRQMLNHYQLPFSSHSFNFECLA